MKKWLILIVIGFICLTLFPGINPTQAQGEGDLNVVLSHLREQYGTSKTFQADYTRALVPKIASKLPDPSFQAEGLLYFRAPNNLRIDQKKPREEQLICNGDKVWWYQPEDKLVHLYRLKDYALQIKPIIDFLSGLGGLEKNFSVRLDNTLPKETAFYQLLLQPKKPQPELQQIQVRVSKTTFLPLEFTSFNFLGDGIRFRFSQIQLGVPLTGSWFEFTPPKGTKINSQSLTPPAKK